MTTLTENAHAGNFIISMSDDGNLSTDNGILASGQGVLYSGAVLGKITASGKYAICDAAASDGTQTAKAILFGRTDATSADAACVVVARHAEVYTSGLIWKSSMNSGAQTTALGQLAGQMIIAR